MLNQVFTIYDCLTLVLYHVPLNQCVLPLVFDQYILTFIYFSSCRFRISWSRFDFLLMDGKNVFNSRLKSNCAGVTFVVECTLFL